MVTAHPCAGVSFGLLAKSSLLSVVNAEMQEVLYAAGLQGNALWVTMVYMYRTSEGFRAIFQRAVKQCWRLEGAVRSAPL